MERLLIQACCTEESFCPVIEDGDAPLEQIRVSLSSNHQRSVDSSNSHNVMLCSQPVLLRPSIGQIGLGKEHRIADKTRTDTVCHLAEPA